MAARAWLSGCGESWLGERDERETGDDIMRGLTPDRFIVNTTQRAFKNREGEARIGDICQVEY